MGYTKTHICMLCNVTVCVYIYSLYNWDSTPKTKPGSFSGNPRRLGNEAFECILKKAKFVIVHFGVIASLPFAGSGVSIEVEVLHRVQVWAQRGADSLDDPGGVCTPLEHMAMNNDLVRGGGKNKNR